MTETDVSFSEWKEVGGVNNCVTPRYGVEDIHKKVHCFVIVRESLYFITLLNSYECRKPNLRRTKPCSNKE